MSAVVPVVPSMSSRLHAWAQSDVQTLVCLVAHNLNGLPFTRLARGQEHIIYYIPGILSFSGKHGVGGAL